MEDEGEKEEEEEDKKKNTILVLNLRLFFKGFLSSYLLRTIIMVGLLSQPESIPSKNQQTNKKKLVFKSERLGSIPST